MAQTKTKKTHFYEALEIPGGIQVEIASGIVRMKGPQGETQRKLRDPGLSVELKEGKVTVKSRGLGQTEKKMFGTFVAHLKNMIYGVSKGYTYVLKICSGHFPMNVSVSAAELIIKNLLGEKVPRVLKLMPNVKVKVEGDMIKVESCDKELAGQAAADIEKLTRRARYDTRIFQDGIYIVHKAGRDIQ